MRHQLKIWPQYFCRVEDGSKTFEVRVNDRGFQPGDEVDLLEYDPKKVNRFYDDPMGGQTITEERGYTGKQLAFRVGYVLPLDAERVVFSLLPIAP